MSNSTKDEFSEKYRLTKMEIAEEVLYWDLIKRLDNYEMEELEKLLKKWFFNQYGGVVTEIIKLLYRSPDYDHRAIIWCLMLAPLLTFNKWIDNIAKHSQAMKVFLKVGLNSKEDKEFNFSNFQIAGVLFWHTSEFRRSTFHTLENNLGFSKGVNEADPNKYHHTRIFFYNHNEKLALTMGQIFSEHLVNNTNFYNPEIIRGLDEDISKEFGDKNWTFLIEERPLETNFMFTENAWCKIYYEETNYRHDW